MGHYLMTNFNKELRPLLPDDLKQRITNGMRKKAPQKGMEDEERMIDLRPPVAEMTTGQLIMELQLNGLNKIASELLRRVMMIEYRQRKEMR
jgi:hypothetical protein